MGGIVGIDEDELSKLTKTIEVFSELGFIEIDEENIVRLPEYSGEGTVEAGRNDSKNEISTREYLDGQSNIEGKMIEKHADGITTSLEITINATKMEEEDLRNKLEIIEEFITHDEE